MVLVDTSVWIAVFRRPARIDLEAVIEFDEVLMGSVRFENDENNNRAPDTNEGVAGLSVRALDGSTNQVLGQTFTDSYGHAVLAVSAPGEVRLSVPYLSYNQLIKPPGKELFVRLTPLRLPSLIP